MNKIGKILVNTVDFIHTVVFLCVPCILYSLFNTIPTLEWALLALFSLNLLVGRCILTEIENKVRAYFQMPLIKSWIREGRLARLVKSMFNN